MDEATRTLILEQIRRVIDTAVKSLPDNERTCGCDECNDRRTDVAALAVSEVFVTFTIFRELDQ